MFRQTEMNVTLFDWQRLPLTFILNKRYFTII